ncbi:uncharacterized protein NEMAJ01_2350 [Nematocida major]|uniref:uncharacterized protein n=1 Tax=Nematocida major TaxID=1912982 RepID=UPI002008D594|nr:uncharacterized protein NEMAJ01_2350 [Nematocida major]KAH9387454.1 hypothetical protein NEMAJ01_2350 [Nematocida major]
MRFLFLLPMLLALSKGAARLPLDVLVDAHSAVFGEEAVSIDPRGPLSLLRGYVYAQQGYMHNKRFFSPEIETSYSLGFSAEGAGVPRSVFKRQAELDRAYPSEGACAESESARRYHSMLVQMFPSGAGSLSICSGRKDSLYRFLQSVCSQTQACYVLAALLLLSEGESVPIEATQKSVTLWKSWDSKAQFEKAAKGQKGSSIGPYAVFHLDTRAGDERHSRKEVAQVVRFFRQHQAQACMPCTQEEFQAGAFLDTPQFLIQAYVFEYIYSKEDAVELARCAYEILRNLGQRMDANGGTLRTYFVYAGERGRAEEDLCMLQEAQAALEKLRWFPLSSLDAHKSAPLYDRRLGAFSKETFSSCVEAGLLFLFCCLAFDPEKKKYSARKLLGKQFHEAAACDLRGFFCAGKSPQEQPARSLAAKQWQKVVSDLPCGRIAYCKGPPNNEMRTGLLNVLYAVARVTGRHAEENAQIDALLEKVNSKEESPHEACAHVAAYASRLLCLLSVNKQLKVEFQDIRKGMRKDGVQDVFGSVVLKYAGKDCKDVQGLRLDFFPGHLSTSLLQPKIWLSSEELCRLAAAASACRRQKTFVGFLFAEHIDALAAGPSQESEQDEAHRVARLVQDAVLKSPGKLNAIFMGGCIAEPSCKSSFARSLSLYAKGERIALTRAHPIVRLISNLLASASLDNCSVQYSMLVALACTYGLEVLRPKVVLSRSRESFFFKSPQLPACIKGHTLEGYPRAAEILLGYFRAYTTKAEHALHLSSALSGCRAVYNVFHCLSSDRTGGAAEELSRMLCSPGDKGVPEDALALKSALSFVWFSISCMQRADSPELVLRLYRAIDVGTPVAGTLDRFDHMYDGKRKKHTVRYMEKHRASLEKAGGKAKFAEVLEAFSGIRPPRAP